MINMKRLLIAFFLLGSTAPVIALESWPQGSLPSKEQVEYNAIKLQIAAINAQFANCGFSSPARVQAVINLLKQIGTPISYKIYKEMFPKGY